MTTKELADRLMRQTDPGDLSALTMRQGKEVADAISFALMEFSTLCPDHMTRTTASVTLPEPKTVTIGVTKGSTTVTDYTFASDEIGCTIKIDGLLNEVDTTATLMDEYHGETGTKTATLYYDAVNMANNRKIRRIANDPWVFDGYRCTHQLYRVPSDHAPLGTYHSTSQRWTSRASHWYDDWNIGEPRHYSIMETGNSSGSEQWFILKVGPSPESTTTLRFDLELESDFICWTQINHFPIDLPYSDQQILSVIMPFAEKRLLTSSLFDWTRPQAKAVAQQLEQNYSHARGILDQEAPDRGKPQTSRGTPWGW
jgi:hypothetical protein